MKIQTIVGYHITLRCHNLSAAFHW